MAFDLNGFYNQYKDYYGDVPLENVAKDAFSLLDIGKDVTYDDWKKQSGVNPIIEEDKYQRESQKARLDTPGILGEFGRSIGRGVTQTLPGQIGKGLQWLDPDGGNEVVSNAGKSLEQLGIDNQKQFPGLTMSAEAENASNWNPRKWVAHGGESLVQSVAPMAIGLAAGAVGGPVAGLLGAGAAAAGTIGKVAGAATGLAALGEMFYGGTAEDTYREGIKKGLSPQEAKDLANITGGVEAGGELVQDLIPIPFFKGLGKAAKGTIIKTLTSRAPAKVMLGNVLKTIAGEELTESSQQAAQTYAAQRYGVADQSIMDSVQEVWGPTLVTSLIFGAGGIGYNTAHRANVRKALTDPSVDPNTRLSAINEVAQAARDSNKEVGDNFYAKAVDLWRQAKPITIDDDQFYAPIVPPTTGIPPAGAGTGDVGTNAITIGDLSGPGMGVGGTTTITPRTGASGIQGLVDSRRDILEQDTRMKAADLESRGQRGFTPPTGPITAALSTVTNTIIPDQTFQPMGAPSTAEQSAQVLAGAQTPAIDSAGVFQDAINRGDLNVPYAPGVNEDQGFDTEIKPKDITGLSLEDLRKARPAFEARNRPDVLAMIDDEIAKKKNKIPEPLQKIFGIMWDEINAGGVESARDLSEGGKPKPVGTASTHAQWVRDLNDALKKEGGFGKEVFNTVVSKKMNDQPLTDPQSVVWKALEAKAGEYNKQHPDTIADLDDAAMREAGFEPYRYPVPVKEMQYGDRLFIKGEIFELTGHDMDGNYVMQDGEPITVHPDGIVTGVEGVAYGDKVKEPIIYGSEKKDQPVANAPIDPEGAVDLTSPVDAPAIAAPVSAPIEQALQESEPQITGDASGLKAGTQAPEIGQPPVEQPVSTQDLTYKELNKQAKDYQGTGGITTEAIKNKFVAAFRDNETGKLYPVKGVHDLNQLPDELVTQRHPEDNEVEAVKASVEPGFMKNGQFFTRDEAVKEQQKGVIPDGKSQETETLLTFEEAKSIEEKIYSEQPAPLKKSQQGDLAAMSAYDKAKSEWNNRYREAVKNTEQAQIRNNTPDASDVSAPSGVTSEADVPGAQPATPPLGEAEAAPNTTGQLPTQVPNITDKKPVHLMTQDEFYAKKHGENPGETNRGIAPDWDEVEKETGIKFEVKTDKTVRPITKRGADGKLSQTFTPEEESKLKTAFEERGHKTDNQYRDNRLKSGQDMIPLNPGQGFRVISNGLYPTNAEHYRKVKAALQSGELSHEDYTRLHEKDYGQIEKFAPGVAATEKVETAETGVVAQPPEKVENRGKYYKGSTIAIKQLDLQKASSTGHEITATYMPFMYDGAKFLAVKKIIPGSNRDHYEVQSPDGHVVPSFRRNESPYQSSFHNLTVKNLKDFHNKVSILAKDTSIVFLDSFYYDNLSPTSKQPSTSESPKVGTVVINGTDTGKIYNEFGTPMVRIETYGKPNVPWTKDWVEKQDAIPKTGAMAKVADYYTPGNIIPSYHGGFDRVVKFNIGNVDSEYDGWYVIVESVIKDNNGNWVLEHKDEPNMKYSEWPSKEALEKGPIERVSEVGQPSGDEADKQLKTAAQPPEKVGTIVSNGTDFGKLYKSDGNPMVRIENKPSVPWTKDWTDAGVEAGSEIGVRKVTRKDELLVGKFKAFVQNAKPSIGGTISVDAFGDSEYEAKERAIRAYKDEITSRTEQLTNFNPLDLLMNSEAQPPAPKTVEKTITAKQEVISKLSDIRDSISKEIADRTAKDVTVPNDSRIDWNERQEIKRNRALIKVEQVALDDINDAMNRVESNEDIRKVLSDHRLNLDNYIAKYKDWHAGILKKLETEQSSASATNGEFEETGITQGQRRAAVGGEFGANGEWYEGGKFIANTDAAKTHKKWKKPTGNREIDTGVWGKMPSLDGDFIPVPLYGQMAGIETRNADGSFSLNPKLSGDYLTKENLKARNEITDAWNKGARWSVVEMADDGSRKITGRYLDITGKEINEQSSASTTEASPNDAGEAQTGKGIQGQGVKTDNSIKTDVIRGVVSGHEDNFIGQNGKGVNLYQDENGKRYKITGDVRINEPNPLTTSRGAVIGVRKDSGWQTVKEVQDASKATVNPSIPESSFIGTLALSADSPEQLRAGDVHRVMSDANSRGYAKEFGQWLLSKGLSDRVNTEIEGFLKVISENQPIKDETQDQKTSSEKPALYKIGDIVVPTKDSGIKDNGPGEVQHSTYSNGVQNIQVDGYGGMHFYASDFELHNTPIEPVAKSDRATENKPQDQKQPATESTKTPSESIAKWVSDKFGTGKKFTWQELFDKSDEAFGGSQSQGTYTSKDAYDAMELGVNQFILENKNGMYDPNKDQNAAIGAVTGLKARVNTLLPTQTKRTAEQDEFQQFSTPPQHAYIAAWVANISPNDIVFEPSAGVGGLAVFAKNANANAVYVNELSPRRAALLDTMGFDHVYRENAEQVNNILSKDVKPTVVLMNPPFSATAGRMQGQRKTTNATTHIEQALAMLEPGGRLVAIVGEGMSQGMPTFANWWHKIKNQYTVRANVGINGSEYAKYGTTFDQQILVIDKVLDKNYKTLTGNVDKVEDLLSLLNEVRNERRQVDPSRAGKQEGDKPVVENVAQEGGGISRTGEPLLPPTGAVGSGERATGHRDQAGSEGVAGESGVSLESDGRNGDVGDGGRGRDNGSRREDQHERPDRGSDSDIGSTGQPSDGTNGQLSTSTEELQIEAAKKEASGEIVEGSLYEGYSPEKITIKGAKKHPTPLVQSAAMASVSPPTPTYRPSIPITSITSGKISDAQLETIVYAGQAHNEILPSGERKGYFVGDSTGVGKGREIAGIFWDNFRNGRKKGVWLSEKKPLFKDAQRDISGVGWSPDIVFDHGKIKAGAKIKSLEGILFTTYDTLKSTEKNKSEKNVLSRLDQIVNWLGKDFDGVIAFDESHNMGNAVAVKGTRGTTKPSEKALAGIALQKALPNARIVYVSATGATDIVNLAYAERLGLWGEGTPFPTKIAFINAMSQGGTATMEMVAQNMKASGVYIARSLSYDGVTYDRLEHVLSEPQRQIYDKLAEGWQVILQNINEALNLTGVTATTDAGTTVTMESGAKSAALSAFWGANQRFFNQVITAMQTPSVIKKMKTDLANDEAVIIQLVNTMESAQERALSKLSKEDSLDDLDLTPRDGMMQLVENSFPVLMYEQYTDDEGNIRARIVLDSEGHKVINPEAVALRDRLLDELGSIKVPDAPIDMILNAFGVDNVAEITGRKKRVVNKSTERGMERVVEKRGKLAIDAEADEYMNGKRNILIFSQAGGTGRSYHADLDAVNQKKRNHYLLQAGWRADAAVQGLGRSHRSNQKQPPAYFLVTTDLKGQKRFLSSIARKLDQLGALTKGQRETGSQGIFQARDNLESSYAMDALTIFYQDLIHGQIDGLSVDDFQDQTGLSLVSDRGEVRTDMPPIKQFLNRLLSMKIDQQNKTFDEFSSRMDNVIKYHAENGTLDVGMETLKAKEIKKVDEQTVYTDQKTGAITRYVNLQLTNDAYFLDFEYVKNDRFFINNKSGKIWAVSSPRDVTNPDTGAIESKFPLYSITATRQNIKVSDFSNEKWTELTNKAEAKAVWNEEIKKAPQTDVSNKHIVTGLLLPIWDRLSGYPKLMRVQTNDGERMIGRLIRSDELKDTLKKLGATNNSIAATPEEIHAKILNDGASVSLVNGWTISRKLVSGEHRIELKGPGYSNTDILKKYGVFTERIQYDTRFFIPTGKDGIKTIEQIIKYNPMSELKEAKGKGTVASAVSEPASGKGIKPTDANPQSITTEDPLIPEEQKTYSVEKIEKTPISTLHKEDLKRKTKGYYVSGELDYAQYATVLEMLHQDNLDSVQSIVDLVEKNRGDSSIGSADKRKASIIKGKVDVDILIKTLGASMYQSNLAEVTIKETIQNSFDAIKAALNTKLMKHGKIDIILNPDTRTIAIRDNGVGMTRKIIEDAFVTLGGSDKTGLSESERSGGFGMAKLAFLLGNTKISVNTVRHGIKTVFKFAGVDLFSKGIKDVTTEHVDKSQHGTVLLITVPSVLDFNGEKRDVYFPTSARDTSFLRNPLLQDNLTIQSKTVYSENSDSLLDANDSEWDSFREDDILKLGSHFDETKYDTPLHANFSWGTADIYIGIERKKDAWIANHSVLSSGLFQFDDTFKEGGTEGKKIPHDMVINIKPSVPATSSVYPFNIKREGWNNAINKDIESLSMYVSSIYRGMEAQQTVNTFKDIRALTKLDIGNVGTQNVDISEFIRPVKNVSDKGNAIFKPTLVNISNGVVTGKNEKGESVVVAQTKEIANKEKPSSSFTPDKAAASARDFLLNVGIDDNKPIFHNNTGVDYNEIAKEAGYNADTLFSELGSVMLSVRDIIAEKLGNNPYAPYRRLSQKESSNFVGISIDKEYYGVHINVPFHGIFLNPLAIKSKTLPGLTHGYYDTIVHEFTHIIAGKHDEVFSSSHSSLRTELASDGTDIEIKMALARVLKKHQNLINLLRNEYEKSTTRNVAKSLHEGGTDKSGIAERRPDASDVSGRVDAGDKQRLVSARKEQPSGKTVRYGVEGSSKIQNDRGINGKASGEGLVTKDDILFSDANVTKDKSGVGSVSMKQAENALQPMIDKVNAQGKIKIVLDASVETIEDIATRTVITNYKNQGRRVKAYLDNQTQEIHLIVENASSIDGLTKALIHELVGHHGLYEFMGADLTPFLDFLNRHSKYSEQVKAEAKVRGISMNTKAGQDRAAKEWFAGIVERGEIEPSLWTQIVKYFKSALRNMGFNVEFTDSDIAEIIRGARKAVEGRGAEYSKSGVFGKPAFDLQDVFHGGPHVWSPEPGFPHGRPRLDKIGTGEGAAVYGYGWYSSDTEAVGRQYKAALSDKPVILLDGKPYAGDVYKAALPDIFRDSKDAKDVEAHLRNDVKELAPHDGEYSKKINDLADMVAAGRLVAEIPGTLYKLDIPDAVIPKLLDWDRPLSDQSEYVKSRLEKSGILEEWNSETEGYDDLFGSIEKTGEGLYDFVLKKEIGGVSQGKKAASEYLASIGIPGNKYQDGMTRKVSVKQNAQTGDWFVDGAGVGRAFKTKEAAWREAEKSISRNYVLWDQKVLNQVALLERNGEKLDAIRGAENQIDYSMAGQKAKTANLDTLEQAKRMEENGQDRASILRDTGWWKISGDWKFEIDDSRIKIRDNAISSIGKGKPVLDVLDGLEKLRAAYPKLIGTTIVEKTASTEYIAAADSAKSKIYISDKFIALPAEGQTGALIHELAHLIQKIEGFSTGASPEDFNTKKNIAGLSKSFYGFAPTNVPEVNPDFDYAYSDNLKKKMVENNILGMKQPPSFGAYVKEKTGGKIGDLKGKAKQLLKEEHFEKFGNISNLLYGVEKEALTQTQKSFYKRVAGEVEARVIQKRANMSPGDRAIEAPWVTMRNLMIEEGLIKSDQNPENVLIDRRVKKDDAGIDYSMAGKKAETADLGTLKQAEQMDSVYKKSLEGVRNLSKPKIEKVNDGGSLGWKLTIDGKYEGRFSTKAEAQSELDGLVSVQEKKLSDRRKSTREAILKATGWWKGYEGSWKFEIIPENIQTTKTFETVFNDFKNKNTGKYLPKLEDIKLSRRVVVPGTVERSVVDESWEIELHKTPEGGGFVQLVSNEGDIDIISRRKLFADAKEVYDKQIESIIKQNANQSRIALWDGTVSDLIKYDELFKAYPDLKDLQVIIRDKTAKDTSGGYAASNHIALLIYDKEGRTLKKFDPTTIDLENKNIANTLIHEIQHIIQDKEDFARGIDPKYIALTDKSAKAVDDADNKLPEFNKEKVAWWESKAYAKIAKAMKKAFKTGDNAEFDKLRKEANDPIDAINKREEAFRKSIRGQDGSYAKYMKTMGEAEARMVTIRTNMTPEQRKAEAPWITMERMMLDEGLLKPGQKPEDVLVNRGAWNGFSMATSEELKGMGWKPENAQRTQITNTVKTYEKIREYLQSIGVSNNILDYGAGKGLGSNVLSSDSFEPFPNGWEPSFKNPKDINKKYDAIVSSYVLNVVPDDIRDGIVSHIGTLLKDGGKAIILARGKDVLDAKTGVSTGDMEVLTGKGTFQKGFTNAELKTYVSDILGDGYKVSNVSIGSAPAAILVEKKSNFTPEFSGISAAPDPRIDFSDTIEDAPLTGTVLPQISRLTAWLDSHGYKEKAEQIATYFWDQNASITARQKELGELPESQDYDMKKRLMGKRIADEVELFNRDRVKPIIQEMADNNLKTENVDELLHADHAPERNLQMKRINARRYIDAVIGNMTDAEAAPYQSMIYEIGDELDAAGLFNGDISVLNEKRDAYVEMMDALSRNVSSTADVEQQKIDDLTNTLNNREFTEEEIASGTQARKQKEIDNKQKRLDQRISITEYWEDVKDRLSGMTNEKSKEIKDKWAGNTAIKSIADKLRKINSDAFDMMHDVGELTDEEHDAMGSPYELHVPLMREGFPEGKAATGMSGYGPLGKPIKIAVGSTRKVINITANIIDRYQSEINRKHKLDASRALYEMVLNNPDENRWEIVKQKKVPRLDDEGNVRYFNENPRNLEDNEVFVKVDGQLYKIGVPFDNPSMMRWMEAIKRTPTELGPFLKSSRKIVRFLAGLNTSFSPEFLISNFIRDLPVAMIHLESIDGVKGAQKAVMKHIKSAIKGIYQAERGDESSEMAKLYRDFAKHGGKVGWMQGYDSVAELAKNFEKELAFKEGKYPNMEKLQKLGKLITDMNTAVENGVRLSAYKVMIDGGMSKLKAATAASGLTIDFTQHGTAGPIINSLYMFANAGIQGNVRMIKALNTPKIRKIAATIVGFGIVANLLGAMTGGDDDDGEPYYDKLKRTNSNLFERNMIFMIPGSKGKYFKIPMPYGYNAFFVLGNEMAGVIRGQSPIDSMARIGSVLMNVLNPLASATLLQTVVPTIADPIAQVMENKSYSGNALMPEKNPFGIPAPDSERYFKSVNPALKSVAQWVNSVTGGNKYKPGLIDVSPETLEMVVETFTGSAGRLFKDAMFLPSSAVSGDLEMNKVPFVRRVFGSSSEKINNSIYRKNNDKVDILIKRMKDADGSDRTELAKNPLSQMVAFHKNVESRMLRLNKMNKIAEKLGREENIKKNEEEMMRLKIQYNKRFNQLINVK